MLDRIKCFFGWHGWKWSVSESGWGENGNPPDDAICEYCGVRYKE